MKIIKKLKINDELYNINKILFCESNPIPIKTAMYLAGLIESLEFRLPLCSPSKENFAKIEEVMKNIRSKDFNEYRISRKNFSD